MKAARNTRNRDLAKIHIGAKTLGMDPEDRDPDSDYRSMLWAVARVRNAADLDHAGRKQVLDFLYARGFRPSNRPGQAALKRPRGTAQARLIHHIWNRLTDFGVVQNQGGLGAWLQANTRRDHPGGIGWQTPEFLPPEIRNRIIEQLKAWAEREEVKWR